MQRRNLLKLGVASAAALAVAGGAMVWIKPGLSGGALSAGAREVFTSVGNAILDGTLPASATPARVQAINGLLQRLDDLAAALPPHTQAELSQLLALLASPPGRLGVAGLTSPWAEASTAAVQLALQSMRVSRISLRQQAYHALHELVSGAYFADASTWPAMGYPGPLKI